MTVRGEVAKLTSQPLNGWRSKTKLRELVVPDAKGVVAQHSLVPGSVRVRRDGKELQHGRDFLVDHQWGAIASTSAAGLPDGVGVEVDYSYALRRLDAWVQRPDGSRVVVPGRPDLVCPLPPAIEEGHHRLANLYVDYHQPGEEAEVYWVLSRQRPSTLTTTGRLPKAVAKLQAGQAVSIVCWGDSVTAGGDVSRPELAFPRRLETELRQRYREADIEVHAVAVGGSESRNWLEPTRHPHPHHPGDCDWNRVAELHPDVVIVEFVNDDQFTSGDTLPMYRRILDRITRLDAEAVLVLPHFTAPGWLHFKSCFDPELRQYVFDLLTLSAERRVAVADVSSRWAALWSQGLPYSTLLSNGINHPDDRGHQIFSEELTSCFR